MDILHFDCRAAIVVSSDFAIEVQFILSKIGLGGLSHIIVQTIVAGG
jgi:hypothetical protein